MWPYVSMIAVVIGVILLQRRIEGAPVMSKEFLFVCGGGAVVILGTFFLKDFFVSRAYKNFKKQLPNLETLNVSVKILQLGFETGWDEGALTYADGLLSFQGHNSQMKLPLRDFTWKLESETLTLKSKHILDLTIVIKDEGIAFGMNENYPQKGFRIWTLETTDNADATFYPPLSIMPGSHGLVFLTCLMTVAWLGTTAYILTTPPKIDQQTALVIAICLLPQLAIVVSLLLFFRSAKSKLKVLANQRAQTISVEVVPGFTSLVRDRTQRVE